jgi:hypothetical protein
MGHGAKVRCFDYAQQPGQRRIFCTSSLPCSRSLSVAEVLLPLLPLLRYSLLPARLETADSEERESINVTHDCY